ncbi:sensor histidine kinase [Ornithinimicrobium avium]|nr:histidine kinase [Ornithinimicrobium avium]
MDELRETIGELRRHPWAPDVALVGALAAWVLLTGVVLGGGATLLGLVQVLPLFVRRRRPLTAALLVALGCLVQLALLDEPIPANVAVPVAVYSAAAFGDRRTSRLGLALGLVGAVLAGLAWSFGGPELAQQLAAASVQMFFMATFVGAAWVLGDVVRRRKEVLSRLQAQHRALARDTAQRTRLVAQGERASIAREMHDVVAHSLAVVVVQADGALYAARQALDAPPAIGPDRAALERAAQTLDTLAQTARDSLADTRRLVGVLRDEDAGAEFSPLQGLAYLDDLVQRVRDSGVAVDVVVRGRTEDLPREVDLAAYRVVQESLTNVLKHAGPQAHVDVDVMRTPAVLLVRVTDDGTGAPPDADGEGNGVLGMAERAEVLGGSVHAGPRARGGWEVVATIPVDDDASGAGARPAAGGER